VYTSALKVYTSALKVYTSALKVYTSALKKFGGLKTIATFVPCKSDLDFKSNRKYKQDNPYDKRSKSQHRRCLRRFGRPRSDFEKYVYPPLNSWKSNSYNAVNRTASFLSPYLFFFWFKPIFDWLRPIFDSPEAQKTKTEKRLCVNNINQIIN
jgi:hypothetical protein